jgi:hypothetical protein
MNQLRTVTAPTVQLLAWITEQSRSYAETIEAWQTSCPRLAVWEDALADHLVRDRSRVGAADVRRLGSPELKLV